MGELPTADPDDGDSSRIASTSPVTNSSEGSLPEYRAPDSGMTVKDDAAHKPDHVVIFVHGMGAALKGGTLHEWAEPLIESLSDVAHDEGGSESPLVIDAAHHSLETPEIWLSVSRPSAERKKILLTEAHWGNEFSPAKAGATWLWAVQMASRVLKRVFGLIHWNMYPASLSADRYKLGFLLRWVLPGLMALVSLPAALALLLVLGFLILISHIPGLGTWVGRLVMLFAEFLGDPAVWARQPTQAAAMRQRVIDILERVPQGADVTVVAHSQGAAVAGQVLLTGRAKATNFITVGSGLPLLGYARYGSISPNVGKSPVRDWTENAPELRWINLWGKFDFVPAGPMGSYDTNEGKTRIGKTFKALYAPTPEDFAKLGYGPEEHPIYNRSGIIHDHIVYSKNRIEVLDPIAKLVYDDQSMMAGKQDASSVVFQKPKGQEARLKQHRRMVSFLGMTRLLALAAGVFLAPPMHSWLQSITWFQEMAGCVLDTKATAFLSWWPCSHSGINWGTWATWTEFWVFILMLGIISAALIWLLNGALWTKLHGRLERRYNIKGEVRHATSRYFWWYVAAVGSLTVGLPVIFGSFPITAWWQWRAAFVLTALILFLISYKSGQKINPLPARLKKPDTGQETAVA